MGKGKNKVWCLLMVVFILGILAISAMLLIKTFAKMRLNNNGSQNTRTSLRTNKNALELTILSGDQYQAEEAWSVLNSKVNKSNLGSVEEWIDLQRVLIIP